MRRATPSDRAAVETFLHDHVETSMFPLSNLLRYGMNGGHPRAVSFWLAEREARITDVLTLTDEGMVMPQCPTGDWPAVARALTGRMISGVIGETRAARAVQAALGLTHAPCQTDHDDIMFDLPLSQLVMPPDRGRLIPMADAPRALMVQWMASYMTEALGVPPDQAAARARSQVAEYAARGSYVVLAVDELPVAMTGLNAALPDIVQVGGVYTPPALRGRGYARQVVARHLRRLRDGGCRRALLFANDPAAQRAYRALGFREAGRFTLCVFDGLQKVAS